MKIPFISGWKKIEKQTTLGQSKYFYQAGDKDFRQKQYRIGYNSIVCYFLWNYMKLFHIRTGQPFCRLPSPTVVIMMSLLAQTCQTIFGLVLLILLATNGLTNCRWLCAAGGQQLCCSLSFCVRLISPGS